MISMTRDPAPLGTHGPSAARYPSWPMLAAMFPAPPTPTFAPGQSATSPGYFRYEDAAQDARLMPIALPQVLAGLWREVLVEHVGALNALKGGILPILTRMTLVTTAAPIRVDRPYEATSGFELAHDLEPGTSDVSRLFMNVWSEVRGVGGGLSRQRSVCGRSHARRHGVRGAHLHAAVRAAGRASRHAARRRGLSGGSRGALSQHPRRRTARKKRCAGATWIDELARYRPTASRSIRPIRTSTSIRWSISGCFSTRSIAVSPPPASRCACAAVRSTSRIASRASPAIASARSSGCSSTQTASAPLVRSPATTASRGATCGSS